MDKQIKCEIEGCDKKAIGIIRCKLVCSNCFKILQRDNFNKFRNNEDITDSLIITKPCYKYKCINRITTILKYVNGEVLPKYCSFECEEKDKQIIDKRYKIINEFKQQGKFPNRFKSMLI